MANVKAKPARLRVVFDGDSMANYPTTPTEGTTRMPAENYPAKIMAGRTNPAISVAQDGESWDEATASGLAVAQFNQALTTGLFMVGGHVEVEQLATAADIYAEWVAYADAARTAGADWVVAGTCCPASNFDAAEETLRQDSNALIIADASTAFDAVVDIASVSGLDNFLSANYSDSVHWTAAGATLAANTFLADATVLALLNA